MGFSDVASLYFQLECHQGCINSALLSTLDYLLSIHGILYDRPNDFYRSNVFLFRFCSMQPKYYENRELN